jgi:uncharacterized protein YndB with AHSA1/START domain
MNTIGTPNTIVKEITIKAPAERIFAALTDPDQRLQWWGRAGRFKAVRVESDLRPGGAWMMSFDANGKSSAVRGAYRKIAPPRLLEFTWLPDWDETASETIVRFDIEEREGSTTVRVTHSGLPTASLQRHQGWPDLLLALRAYTEDDHDA